jgi:hypothetical protein
MWVTWRFVEDPDSDVHLMRIFYHRENARRKNEAVNDLAHKFADWEHNYTQGKVALDGVEFRIEDSFPLEDFESFDACYEWEPYKVFKTLIAGVDRKLYGKNFGSIVKKYDRMYNIAYGFNNQKYRREELNKDKILTNLLRLVREYDVVAFSWMRAFWYKPWLRQVSRQQGMSYLPTHKI